MEIRACEGELYSCGNLEIASVMDLKLMYLHEWLMMIISSRGVKPCGNLTSDISLAFLLIIYFISVAYFSTALQSQCIFRSAFGCLFIFLHLPKCYWQTILMDSGAEYIWLWFFFASLFSSHTKWFYFLIHQKSVKWKLWQHSSLD